MATKQYTKYLVFGAGGDVRVVSTLRSLTYTEVAYRLKVSVPESWGRIAGDINVELPGQDGEVELVPVPLKRAPAEAEEA